MMPASDFPVTVSLAGADPFGQTRWSVVMEAAQSQTGETAAAREAFCRQYLRPVTAFLKARGLSHHDAEDVGADFFAKLLHEGGLKKFTPGEARFRSWLKTMLRNFLFKHWRDAGRLKRGGGVDHVALDPSPAEGSPVVDPADDSDDGPERAFDQQCAWVLMERVVGRLREEAGSAFEALKGFIPGAGSGSTDYALAAAALGAGEDTCRKRVQRLRERYRSLLREEVARTVGSDGEVEDELRYLVQMAASMA
jgi:RNA polymerase sigma-70 factor (ECF subfamily)